MLTELQKTTRESSDFSLFLEMAFWSALIVEDAQNCTRSTLRSTLCTYLKRRKWHKVEDVERPVANNSTSLLSGHEQPSV